MCILLIFEKAPIRHQKVFYLGFRGLSSPPRIFNLVDYTPPTYDGYEFPAWGHAIGWLVAMTSIIAIPIFAFLQILKERSTLKEAS